MAAQVLFVLVLLSWNSFTTSGLNLPDYADCCHYCKGEEHLWTTVRPAWNLTLQDGVAEFVTSFSDPSAYLVEDEMQAITTLYERDYLLRYAGAPVRIDYTAISQSAVILNSQYIELNLGVPMDVAGVSVQGGFYEETNNELLERRESWVTDFIVSYATAPGSFQYINGENGIEVYSAYTDSMDIYLADFGQVITAQYIRVHPLGAVDENGATNKALFRASTIICTMTTCERPRLNCVSGDWGRWSGCKCRWDGCKRTRHRDVMRYQSCGGVACGTNTESKLCSSPEPLWKTIVMWVGICLLLLTILLVVIYLIYRKYKKRKPEVAFEKDKKPKEQKKKKDRNMREDNSDLKEENLDGEDGNDFVERELAPESSSAVAGGAAGGAGAGAGAGVAGGALAAGAARKKNKNKGAAPEEIEEADTHPDGLYNDKKGMGNPPQAVEAAPADTRSDDPWGRPKPRGRAQKSQNLSSLPPIQSTNTKRDDDLFY